MLRSRRIQGRARWAGIALLLAAGASPAAEFRVSFAPNVTPGPFTGRLYVMTSQGGGREPRFGPNWFRPQPFFAVDVKDLKPGTPVVVGSNAIGFPAPIPELPTGRYSVQAVLDLNLGGRDFSNSPGNGYSSVQTVDLGPLTAPVELTIDKVVVERPFQDSARTKLFEMKSELVSKFAGREVKLRGAVVLPKSFATSPDKKYPILYEIPGFGGRHFGARESRSEIGGVEFLYVQLDPDCSLGHHVFADSANNGPYGEALTKEFIPALEAKFRAIGAAGARFVTGHSSGGWSSLWLQVAYPDVFGGVWSTAPDPVDFRDFQRINLYASHANMF
ncbi:MAG TPA: alpha/beta hydrolase-fold protein, partial [Planctomycetia bacterium]|nr:alpha/beta hydrolase-fold protein [Planctomycetia bacterium]